VRPDGSSNWNYVAGAGRSVAVTPCFRFRPQPYGTQWGLTSTTMLAAYDLVYGPPLVVFIIYLPQGLVGSVAGKWAVARC